MISIKFAKCIKLNGKINVEHIRNSYNKISYSFSDDVAIVLPPMQRQTVYLGVTGLCDSDYDFILTSPTLWEQRIALYSCCPKREEWYIELVNYTDREITLYKEDLQLNVLVSSSVIESDIEEWTYDEIKG